MKLSKLTFMMLLCIALWSCGEKPNLFYDEAVEGSILSTDLAKSPEENLKAFFAGNNLPTPSLLQVYNASNVGCGCTSSKDMCFCKLPNNPDSSCSESSSKCTVDKYIKIKVEEADMGKYQSIGFNPIN